MTRILLILVITLAAVFRIFTLDKYPAGFTPDEASFGYDAYSILKTGHDQWGQSFPLSFRSFGDFKAPLYTYLTIPSVAIFGLNEFAVRLPNAIFGIFSVFVVYLLTNQLFRQKKLALLAAFLLAVSPWHVSLSRGAFEANLTTFLMPLGIYAFLRGVHSQRWMIVASFAFGLNLFSYHSAKLVTLLLLLTLIWWKRNEYTPIRMSVGKFKWAILVFGLFLSFSFFSFFSGAGSRASDIGIFNPTGGWGAVADRRFEAIQSGLPDVLSRLFSNKPIYVIGEFIKSYLSYLTPTFLFTQGAGESTYGMIPGHGVLYLFELPFILFALFSVIKRPQAPILLIIAWILLSVVPAALTKGPGFAANRVAVMMPAIQILSAYGAFILWEKFAKNKKLLRFYCLFVLTGVFFFLEAYFYHGPRANGPSMSYGWRETIQHINSVGGEYESVIVSKALSEPHIFVAFYNKWDPDTYQKESKDWLRYSKQGLLFVDQLGEWHLGKYTFRDIKYDEDRYLENSLIIGRSKDFPENVVAEKKVSYPDGKPAILIVDPQKQNYAKGN